MTTAICQQCKKTDFAPTTECKACGTRYDDATLARISLDAAKEAQAAAREADNGPMPQGRVCQKCDAVHAGANFHKQERCPACGAIYSHVAATIAKANARQQLQAQASPLSIIVGGVVDLLALHSCTGQSDTAATRSTQTAAQPPTYVSAAELFAAYDANEVSADTRYLGSRLIVDGTVQSIDSGISGPVVSIQTPNEFMPVRADDLPAADAARLSKGQPISVDCIGGGATLGSPWLRNCRLR